MTIKDGKLFDTTRTRNIFNNERAIFVMDEKGQLFASASHIPKKIHHSSFLAGKPIASAGELRIENGIIKEISNKSGHYKPTIIINKQITSHLKKSGVEIKSIKILFDF